MPISERSSSTLPELCEVSSARWADLGQLVAPGIPACVHPTAFVRLRASGRALPDELSTYFRYQRRNIRIPASSERTLIIADKGAYFSYLAGCTGAAARENRFMPPW